MAFLAPLIPIILTAAGVGATAASAIGAAFSIGLAFLVKKKPRQERSAQQLQVQLGETDRRALLGRSWSAGDYVWGFNYDEEPNDRRWEAILYKLADHEINDLEGFTVDGVFYGFEGDGPQSSFAYGGRDHLLIYALMGGTTNVVPSVITANTTEWTANDKMTGCAGVWVLKRGNDSVWPGGRPQFKWFVGGAKVYDPRQDSTVEGGSGTQRESDPTTWAYSENQVVMSLAYRMGVYNYGGATPQLMVGRGLTMAQALGETGTTLAAFMAAASICDEAVALKGGGSRPRYDGGLVIDSSEAYDDVLSRFADSCAGLVVPRAGRLAVLPGSAQTPHDGFTLADIPGGADGEPIEFSRFLPITERINTVVGKFPAETLYGNPGSVVKRVYADLVTDGAGGNPKPHETTLDLSATVYNQTAQRIAEIARREGRLEWRGRITLGPRFANAEVGDWISGTMPEFGSLALTWDDGDVLTWDDGDVMTWDDWNTVMFRIVEEERRINQSKRVALREVSSDVYDWDETTDEEDDLTVTTTPTEAPFALMDWDGGDGLLWDDGDRIGWDGP